MRRHAFIIALGAAALSTACLGLDREDEFVAVDEDYSRLSPVIPATVAGAQGSRALEKSCQEEPDLGAILQTDKEEVFAWALCLCEGFDNVGSGLVARSSSYLLGDDVGRGHVGIGGGVDVVGGFDVDGHLDVAGGIQGVGDLTVNGDLVTGRGVDITGNWSIARDAWIGGDLDVVGSVEIGDELYLRGALYSVGDVTYATGRRGFTYAGPPCPCGASQRIDVAAEVAARRGANDNARLPSGLGSSEITLEPGVYYFGGSSELVGSGRIVTRGHVQLFVEGDIETVGSLNLSPEPGSEVDLWVSGTIDTVGNLSLAADDQRPRSFRLFMGGRGASLVNVGSADFVGAIYAPSVHIDYVGDLNVHGSLFARSIDGTGRINITHDTDLAAPQACADAFYPL